MNAISDWRPGWRTGVAHHIEVTSDIPCRRKRASWWPVVIAALCVAALVAVA